MKQRRMPACFASRCHMPRIGKRIQVAFFFLDRIAFRGPLPNVPTNETVSRLVYRQHNCYVMEVRR